MIKVVCVDEVFRECNLDRVYLNQCFNDISGIIWNDFIIDYFYCFEGLFCDFCFVYKYSIILLLYLQYVDGYWVVISLYRLINFENVMLRVKDFVLRFEYIMKIWWKWLFGWCDMCSFRVLCWGVILMVNICLLKLCGSKGICVYILSNEMFCFCCFGYMGVKCLVSKFCLV